jgi:trimethylamine--corrinoid protein Co-methyltransferase
MWINHVTSAIGKVGLLPFCGSSLNSKAWSPALTVYGNDVIGQARMFAEGFGVDPASLGVDEIVDAMATEKHFLTTPTTLERYREAYFDGIFPHLSLERWEELGRPRADAVLRERTAEMMRDAEPPEDHEEIVARGEAYIARESAPTS